MSPLSKLSFSGDSETALKVFLFLIFFARLLTNLNAPFDRDEKDTAAAIATASATEVLNPLNGTTRFRANTNQYLSTVATFASFKIFGVNSIALRVPALLVALCFFAALLKLISPLSFLPQLFVLSHLVSNHFAMWYLSSSKGYGTLLLFSVLTLSVVLNHRKLSSVKLALAFGMLSLSTCLAHSFGVLFVITLLTAVTFDSWRTKMKLPGALLAAGAISLALVLYPAVRHLLLLTEYGDIWVARQPFFQAVFTNLFGLTHNLMFRITLLSVAAGLLFLRIKSVKRSRRDPCSLLVTMTVLGITALIVFPTLLGTRVFFARYLLPFWLTIVLTVAYVLDEYCETGKGRAIAGLCLVALTAMPLQQGRRIDHMLQANHLAFHHFVKQVREEVKKRPETCLDFAGDARQVRWARQFYFHKETGRCRQQLLGVFAIDSFDRKQPLVDLFTFRGKDVLLDGPGRKLVLSSGIGSRWTGDAP